MWTISQPKCIIFGKNSAKEFPYIENSLIITSKGAKSRGWLDYLKIKNFQIFDEILPNPSIEIAEKIISNFSSTKIDCVIGIGGGSSMDVAKFVGANLQKKKILIPTTFGSGSEVTKISVLNVNNKKTSFHEERFLADVAIVDSNFILDTPDTVIKNSIIDACAQCTEAYDSNNSNYYTKFLCEKAFNILEEAITNNDFEKAPLGALMTGLGFGNSSTTLGHALSYVFSNEGYSHGHALAYCTSVAHNFNSSKFYERFIKLVEILEFPKIKLKQNVDSASEIIFKDRKHLDNNPQAVTKNNIVDLLNEIKSI